MISDLDGLMAEASLAAVVVPMHEQTDPAFRWMTRGAKLTNGFAIHLRGDGTFLVHDPMERDEASASGFQCISMDALGRDEIFRDASSPGEAWAEMYRRAFAAAGVNGEISFFGRVPIELYDVILPALRESGWGVSSGKNGDLLRKARRRKDSSEIGLIEDVGRRTGIVVDTIREVLRRAEIRHGELWSNGSALRIGDLKSTVSSEIARLGMIEDHETILSQGRDAGIPHSRGTAADVVRASSPIVLDIFPADRSTGYFFDFTRTFCVGAIPERLKRLHADVSTAFDIAVDHLRAGVAGIDLHELVCDSFEKKGYPTRRSSSGTVNGYVHGLGHGVGLEVHERPTFSRGAGGIDEIAIGDVLTIEPGLYFPGEGLGVRIEETFVIEEDGSPRSLLSMDRSLEP